MTLKPKALELTQCLAENRIIPKQPPSIEFFPREISPHYRQIRRFIIQHPGLCLGLPLLGVSGAYLIEPSIGKIVAGGGIGVGVLGALARMAGVGDKFAYGNPADTAPILFSNILGKWDEIYGEIKPRNYKELEQYVLTSHVAASVQNIFPQRSDEQKLGILIAKTADLLADAREQGCGHIKKQDLVRMILGQKLDTHKDTDIIRPLQKSKMSPRKIVRDLTTYEQGLETTLDPEVLEVLSKYVTYGQLQLAIQSAHDLHFVAAQQSKGFTRLHTDTGDNAGSFLGMHSSETDFPRLYVEGDAGSGFVTNMRRGLAAIEGSVGHHCAHKAKGGIVLVAGDAAHGFAEGMDDSEFPAIALTSQGMKQPPYGVINGLVINLNFSTEAGRETPEIWRFINGTAKCTSLVLDPVGTRMDLAMTASKQYISEWAEAHPNKLA
jgi:hypothetical protein